MNFNSLQYFLEVARTLSFTKASENLFVSQPGISQQIHLLEEQLGVKLLRRTTRKVELTDEGKYLYEKTLPSLREIQNTFTRLENTNIFPKLIKIATIPSAASLYLPNLLETLHKHYPEIEFYIKETTTANVMEQVRNGAYHFGFIRTTTHFQIENEHELSALEYKKTSMKAVISAQHRLADKKKIQLEDLRDDFFLHYDPQQSTALYNLLENACNGAGFKPKTICTGSELLTISNIISHNLGVTLLPSDMVELVQSDKIRALDVEDVKQHSSITAIWKDDGYLDRNTKLFIEVLTSMKKNS